jgi:hypothetical protein
MNLATEYLVKAAMRGAAQRSRARVLIKCRRYERGDGSSLHHESACFLPKSRAQAYVEKTAHDRMSQSAKEATADATEERGDDAPPAFVERAALAVSVLVATIFAATHVANVADAAHDGGVVRAVGFGSTGGWRALDAMVAAFAVAMPTGTRAFRAGMACAILSGILALVVHRLARVVLASSANASRASQHPLGASLPSVLASVAACTASMSLAWQSEAASPGGSLLGALFIFAPLALIAGIDRIVASRIPLAGFLLGLALSYEPLAFVASLIACVAYAIANIAPWKEAWVSSRRPFIGAAIGVVLGTAPLFFALARSRFAFCIAYGATSFADWSGERGALAQLSPFRSLIDDLGWLVIALAACGLVVLLLVRRARAFGFATALLVASGFVAIALGAPFGPTRFASPWIASIVAISILAGVAMQSFVRLVASARVPFAKASAAMIVLLEIAIPVRIADDTSVHLGARSIDAASTWDDVAWGNLPANSLILVADPRVMKRVAAARASGSMRGDLDIVPTFDLGSRTALRELAFEPKLARLWLDVLLANPPEEWSLSSIAAKRPLIATFDPHWDHALARHLVPIGGLFFRFQPEPRGGSDRRHAFDEASPDLTRLLNEIAPPTSSRTKIGDPDLAIATLPLLHARAITFAAANDRELALRAVDDIMTLSPSDTIADRLAHRIATAKGAIETGDLH